MLPIMSVQFRDYYETLGVARDANAAEIEKAFRKLARKFHPDVAEDKTTAEQKFKEINEAYEVLGDVDKRKKYDQLGADWQRGGNAPPPQWQQAGGTSAGGEFNFGGTGFSDFFEQYFSGASRYGFPERGFDTGSKFGAAHRGNDIEGDILVTLDEAMHGSLRSISLQTTHPRTGKSEVRTFQVRIPAGVTDGKRIRVPGEGEPGHGGPAGDLYLRVKHSAHPDFHTDGADVYHDLDLAPWEAVLGAEISVPTLDGAVKLRIPPGSGNGDHLRVRARGFPKGKSGERGDFYAVLNIQIPAEISPAERSSWERLRDQSSFKPRS